MEYNEYSSGVPEISHYFIKITKIDVFCRFVILWLKKIKIYFKYKDSAETKKKKLEKEYNIVMDVETERKVNTMCNLSEVVLEKGFEHKLNDLVCKKIEKGYEPEQIAEMLEEDITVIEPIYAEIMRQIKN